MISTGKNAFIEYGGVTHEVGEEQIAELRKQGASGAPTGMSGAEALKELSNGDIKRVERMVSDPRFTIEFSIQFKDVDKPVTIEAPSSGKPIEELGEKLAQEFGGGATNPDAIQG